MKIVLPTLHVRRSPQAIPLAAGCLAAALPEELRRRTVLVDLFPDQDQAAMARSVLGEEPSLVAFPLYLWNRRNILTLCGLLKQERPELLLVAGGPEATADPEGVLAEGGLDAVIAGEGEAVFAELVQAFCAGRSLSSVGGVVLRSPMGIQQGTPSVTPRDLDELPSPWLSGALTPKPGGGVLWETSRGCPFGCDFCFDARGSRGVRHISPERMAAELDLFARSGAAQVWVLDSTFNFPPERGKQLLRLIAERAPHIRFHLEAKADFLDRETARLFSRLSCSVQIGLQSVRPEVLTNIHRSFDEGFRRKIHLLAVEGVTFGLDLIYGLPGDDHRGFCHSVNTALAMAPNHLDLFPLALLPGTVLHRQQEKHGIVAREHPPYEILESATYSASDLRRSRLLAAATDIFYNIGRGVGFFSSLVKVAGQDPATFLEGFAHWVLTRKGVNESRFLEAEFWRPEEILPLQEGYVAHLLRSKGEETLVSGALDLMRYHFHYAETLLGPETLPAPSEAVRGRDLWNTLLYTAPALRLVPFTYEILNLLEMGEVDLKDLAAMFRPVGSVALFVRRGEQVFCESLEEDFSRLLNGCREGRAPRDIFGGSISPREGAEIVEFAVAEGFLVPARLERRKAKGDRRKGSGDKGPIPEGSYFSSNSMNPL